MKRIKEFAAKTSAFLAGALALPSKVMAASWFQNPLSNVSTLDNLVSTLLETAIIAAAIVAVVFLIMNGFKYMTSSGDATKTEEAQKGLANALIGLIVCLSAYLIVSFITGRLGYELQNLD
jgi:succinate dehydrogenase/fumarate reductase cytochrome b subunit